MGEQRIKTGLKSKKKSERREKMKGIFGLFTYFSQLDRDGSGYLEKDEIEYLAEMFFGQGDKAAVQKYVNEVFDKFDYDHSGELSYEEARDFIKDVYQFIDKCGGVSDEQRDKFLEVMACDDAPADIKDQEKQQLNEYKDEKIARRSSIMPGDVGEEAANKDEQSRPAVGPNGELLGPDGKPMGPNGEAVAVLPEGVKLGPDGKPILGPNGCLMGADGKPLLGPNGELLGPDGKPLLGPNGELLGPDGKPVLGPGGVALGPDGKPLLGPDGQPIMVDEDMIMAQNASGAGSAMDQFNFEVDPEEMARMEALSAGERRKAEQEARRKA